MRRLSGMTDYLGKSYSQGAFQLIIISFILFILGIFPLKCAVQNYAWGKIGENSIVAELANQDKEFKLEGNQPYAEV